MQIIFINPKSYGDVFCGMQVHKVSDLCTNQINKSSLNCTHTHSHSERAIEWTDERTKHTYEIWKVCTHSYMLRSTFFLSAIFQSTISFFSFLFHFYGLAGRTVGCFFSILHHPNVLSAISLVSWNLWFGLPACILYACVCVCVAWIGSSFFPSFAYTQKNSIRRANVLSSELISYIHAYRTYLTQQIFPLSIRFVVFGIPFFSLFVSNFHSLWNSF